MQRQQHRQLEPIHVLRRHRALPPTLPCSPKLHRPAARLRSTKVRPIASDAASASPVLPEVNTIAARCSIVDLRHRHGPASGHRTSGQQRNRNRQPAGSGRRLGSSHHHAAPGIRRPQRIAGSPFNSAVRPRISPAANPTAKQIAVPAKVYHEPPLRQRRRPKRHGVAQKLRRRDRTLRTMEHGRMRPRGRSSKGVQRYHTYFGSDAPRHAPKGYADSQKCACSAHRPTAIRTRRPARSPAPTRARRSSRAPAPPQTAATPPARSRPPAQPPAATTTRSARQASTSGSAASVASGLVVVRVVLHPSRSISASLSQ